MRQLDIEPVVLGVPREIRFAAGVTPGPVRAGLLNRQKSARRASRTVPRRVVAAGPAARIRPAPVPRRGVAARPAARIRPAPVPRRPAAVNRQVVRRAVRPVQRPVPRELRNVRPARVQAVRPAGKRVVVQHRRAAVVKRGVVRKTVRGTVRRPLRAAGDRASMRAVIAYARAQLGKRYVRGGEGPYGFDCSGFTKRAYARAGLSLPHSSGAQARRARSISRAKARPGDLVVGPGHVGIYMGRGMMIDAGNHRTGVIYRKLYRGLSVERLG
ncbi:NlpC/P60 family protein [Actinoplanes sp. NPDC049802]|uniref:C40 family peptidase n=1 Tax=Actinoplanes sp. NPDC049802 TaxID=3154742 RepID=UPI0034030692